ncbi:V-set and transmembrane domain-containing protein 4 [Paramormyrops kingsleyae]|uniref:V-set and transmembrane domain-containing protein 4 n=1 Tax=Paramormyrops kingsleyae TaxID=1676925 RepID=UPI003B977A27
MKISSVVAILLIKSFAGVGCAGLDKSRRTLCSSHPDVCEALNVTVTPGPVARVLEGDNVTLSCQVAQRRRPDSVLVVRWLFAAFPADEEQLIVKLNMRRAKYYGNYTKRFARPKMRLLEERREQAYGLLILNVSKEDRGHYVCRVQEIRLHQNRWRAASNGTATAELKVRVLATTQNREAIWQLFEDVYLCVVLICSVGLVCMCLFTVVITCQYLQRRRSSRASYYLVKCPQNSSGETVTSVISLSPPMPKKEKKHLDKKGVEAAEIPPAIPAKDKTRGSKLLKPQPRKVALPKIVEESLMYAELELVKPLPESKSACSGTVYAQIVFDERPM